MPWLNLTYGLRHWIIRGTTHRNPFSIHWRLTVKQPCGKRANNVVDYRTWKCSVKQLFRPKQMALLIINQSWSALFIIAYCVTWIESH